ncbi:MAG: hypothetical protein J6W81_03560 [Lentisphaeria bacterium]|nr:hypothetical protein [Lentisphaeria bacterium]
MKKICIALMVLSTTFLFAKGDNVKIGWGREDITPKGPAMLAGQMSKRLSTSVLDPLSTTALALESGKTKVIMISLDNVGFRAPLMNAIRKNVAKATGLNDILIIGSATHTHTAPRYGVVIPIGKTAKDVDEKGKGYGSNGIDVAAIRKEHPDFVDSEQYFDFLVEKISAAALNAWNSRKPGKIAYGLGSAAVGECRRLVVKNKGGVMYAMEDDPAVLNAEAHVDHSLNVLATYTPAGKLTGMVLNLACPSQVSEALKVVSADFWNEVRVDVAKRWGKDVYILPQCSPAGDQSPHKLMNRRADERMMRLRGQLKKPVKGWKWVDRVYDLEYGLGRRREIARMITASLEDVLPTIAKTAESKMVMKSSQKTINLPPRLITKQEYEEAKKDIAKILEIQKKEKVDHSGSINWHKRVITRYETQQKFIPMELNVVRLGDVVFATNTYELYLDYGDRIKGRSKAVQSFLVQLASGTSTYLASKRSGTTGYGSAPASVLISYEGGDTLVEETVKAINELF